VTLVRPLWDLSLSEGAPLIPGRSSCCNLQVAVPIAG
jgi:hypothetical protein